MANYSNETVIAKAKECIKLVREHLGEPTNKLSRYNENAEREKGKFYVVSKKRRLVTLRETEFVDEVEYLSNILEFKSGNCGEYGVYTDILLRLKGFTTYQVVEDYGNDNHCYSILKFNGKYLIVDAWHNNVRDMEFIDNLPTANNAECTSTNENIPAEPTVEYWDANLYNNLKAKAVGKSLATAKIAKIKSDWR